MDLRRAFMPQCARWVRVLRPVAYIEVSLCDIDRDVAALDVVGPVS